MLPEEQKRIRPLANDHVAKLTSLAARCLRQLVGTLGLGPSLVGNASPFWGSLSAGRLDS